MGRLFTDGDLTRWENSHKESIALHLAKLSSSETETEVDFRLGMLAVARHTQGMIDVARGNFPQAVSSFRSAVETRCWQYERFEQGVGRELDAGHFQTLLLALVTRDDALVSRFLGHYRAENGTPTSVFLGRAIKRLVANDRQGARLELARRKLRPDPQFRGYCECLEAIADGNDDGFGDAFAQAATNWQTWAAKTVRGLPESVCFIQGVGLVRLAEQVLGRAVPISHEHVPRELLR
jgi:hypothetical protein